MGKIIQLKIHKLFFTFGQNFHNFEASENFCKKKVNCSDILIDQEKFSKCSSIL